MTERLHRYTTLSERLSGLELRRLDDRPHGAPAWSGGDAQRYIGRFDRTELVAELQIHGILDPMLQRGYGTVNLQIDTGPAGRHRLWVTSRNDLLLELVVWREYLVSSPPVDIARPLKLLAVEYLRSQRPRAAFDRERLPGQLAPGLGVGNQVLALLRSWAVRLDLDGVLILPDYFHAAVLYERGFWFADPDIQGLLQAAKRDLLVSDVSLARASWRFECGAVELTGPLAAAAGSPWLWPSEAEMLPSSEPVRAWFRSDAYATRVADVAASHRFQLIPERLEHADAHAVVERIGSS